MQKEFAPYSNLWLTADKWTKYKASWLNDEFETVDAVAAEKFVEEVILKIYLLFIEYNIIYKLVK